MLKNIELKRVLSVFVLALSLGWTAGAKADGEQILLHDGYWVAKVAMPGFGPRVEVINDMHVDPETLRITVYAQSRILGRTLSPPQVSPGECKGARDGEIHCSHPDAIYLNGSGQELTIADGTGAWWVKHSWVLGGEGYCNTELAPKEVYPPCTPVTGVLLDDGLTMKIGVVGEDAGVGYNLRKPEISRRSVGYSVTRFGNLSGDPTGPATQQFRIEWTCKRRASDLDGRVRDCPKVSG